MWHTLDTHYFVVRSFPCVISSFFKESTSLSVFFEIYSLPITRWHSWPCACEIILNDTGKIDRDLTTKNDSNAWIMCTIRGRLYLIRDHIRYLSFVFFMTKAFSTTFHEYTVKWKKYVSTYVLTTTVEWKRTNVDQIDYIAFHGRITATFNLNFKGI